MLIILIKKKEIVGNPVIIAELVPGWSKQFLKSESTVS